MGERFHGRLRQSDNQPSTDHHRRPQGYLEAVENAFGADIDYAMLQKIYGAPSITKRAILLQPVSVRHESRERRTLTRSM